MEESEIMSNKGLTFLPPIKQSENVLTIANKDPVYVENNINREKELLELTLSKFELLTNQPKNVENCKLTSYSTNSFKRKSFPRATPLNCIWDQKDMPKIKVVRVKNRPADMETANEKRMRLHFEQMNLLKKKNSERANRSQIGHNFNSPSYSFLTTQYHAGMHTEKDSWGSPDYQDVQLNQQICDQFYNNEHRHMRYYRQSEPNFYTFTPNTNLEKMVKASNVDI